LNHSLRLIANGKALCRDRLGSGLGIGTTAEGVETAGQRDQVRSAGVTHMQGYLVARPLPEAQVRAQIVRLSAPLLTDRTSHLE
jgi:predicted signal transduction protein with EAL and GGDEF domain